MDIAVKIERFQIKQNVLNLKSTLVYATLNKRFFGLKLSTLVFRINGFYLINDTCV